MVFVTSLTLLCGLFFIHGIGQGLTDLGGTNVLLTMWGENAAAPLNIVQLGYGIGAVFINLLVRPFFNRICIFLYYRINKSKTKIRSRKGKEKLLR